MANEPAHHSPTWRPRTVMVQSGLLRSEFMETSEALYLTSGYVYRSAEEAEFAFANDGSRFVYSRYANPTVQMFEDRLRLLEGAEACRGTASGMAAVFAALACFVKAGDRIVASRALFGSCLFILQNILPRLGVETVLVDGRDLDQWRAALKPGARAVFLESPSNPTLEIIDLRAVAELAHQASALLVVDNVFATPLLQKPLTVRRRHRLLFGDEAYRRAGADLGRRGAGHAEIRHREPDAVPAPHRPGLEPVQCLGAAEGPRDARSPPRAADGRRARDRALPRAPSQGAAHALSRAREPPAIRAGAGSR